jgi:uncharacterized delta-60 repeat protein
VQAEFGAGGEDHAWTVALQADGSILVAGNTTTTDFRDRIDYAIARLDPSGSFDPSFGVDGRVVMGFALGAWESVAALSELTDGSLVVGGRGDFGLATSYDFMVFVLRPDGSLDPSFGSGGPVAVETNGPYGYDSLTNVFVRPDGALLLTGTSKPRTERAWDFAAAQLTSAGLLDTSFGSSGISNLAFDFAATSIDSASDAILLTDGSYVMVGTSDLLGSPAFAIAKFTAQGELDTGFGSDGRRIVGFESAGSGAAKAIVELPDGRFIVGGVSEGVSSDFALAMLQPDGTLDTGFGMNGVVMTDFGSGSNDRLAALVLLPSGRVVAAGTSDADRTQDFALACYHFDGSLDSRFGQGGMLLTDFGGDERALAMVVDHQGRLLVVGNTAQDDLEDFVAARYLAPGGLTSVASIPTTGLPGLLVLALLLSVWGVARLRADRAVE